MDLGLGETCEYEYTPKDRDWIPRNPNHIELPDVDENYQCEREPYEDFDYCPFHLSRDEQEQLGIDTGERLRELLQRVESGEPDAKEFTDFTGAYLSGADLSDLNFSEMGEFTIDLKCSDIDGELDISGSTFDVDIDCRFARLNRVCAQGGEFTRLRCQGTTIRGVAETASGYDDAAVGLRENPSFDSFSLKSATLGDIYTNELSVDKEFNCQYAKIDGVIRLNSLTANKCNLAHTKVTDNIKILGKSLGSLNCSHVEANNIICEDLSIAEGNANFHSVRGNEISLTRVSAANLVIESPSVESLELNEITVTEETDIVRNVGDRTTVSVLEVDECEFHGRTSFDRLEPETAMFNITRADDLVSFEQFECQDATFKHSAQPMFGDRVCFDEARLEGADLREFGAEGRAEFTNADLTDARMMNADLSGAVLEGALLSRARLVGADFTDAYLYHASLGDASIDASTEFGDRVVYDPESSTKYNPKLGLSTTSGDNSPKNEPESTDPEYTGSEVSQLQKAREVYLSIHNTSRQSGDSETAIEAYVRHQQMGTKRLAAGETGQSSRVPNRIQALGRGLYGIATRYGVGHRRILGISTVVVLAAATVVGLLQARSGEPYVTALYGIGGLVGATPNFDGGLNLSILLGAEALLGALLVALYVNALGRRSSM